MGQMTVFNVDEHLAPYAKVVGQAVQGDSPTPRSLIRRILELDALDTERLVAGLLKAMGCTAVRRTGRPGDGGVDIRARLNAAGLVEVQLYVQVKRYRRDRHHRPRHRARTAQRDSDRRSWPVRDHQRVQPGRGEGRGAGRLSAHRVDRRRAARATGRGARWFVADGPVQAAGFWRQRELIRPDEPFETRGGSLHRGRRPARVTRSRCAIQ